MPPRELTTEQRRALDTRDVSVSLSAGAGCGKTHVLTERFLAHLDPTNNEGGDRAELRQLIAITFTDAAAREMRSRIRAACYKRLEDHNSAEQDRAEWLTLLREIDGARVSTIHSFCAALLRSHAAAAGLDPTFGVLEPGEADVLLQEVLDEVLRLRFAAHDSTTLDLAAEFGTLSQLKQRIALFVEKRHLASFLFWMTDADSLKGKARQLVEAWKESYDKNAFRIAVQAVIEKAPLDEMRRLLRIATPCPTSKKFPAVIATLSELLARLHSSPENITNADLESISENARVQSICKKEDWPTADDFEAYKAACSKLRDVIKKSQPPAWNADAALKAALVGLKLLRLAGDVADEYQLRKRQVAKLDFDDLLALAHRLLADPQNANIREVLSADLRLLLVDEFQDTDPLQVDLIKMICGSGLAEGRLFFVGDFKQSIYRFRGAVPPEFLKLRNAIAEKGQLQLTRNFRSLPGVLSFVNALFYDSFGDEARLEANRVATPASPNVEFLWTIPNIADTGVKGNVEIARRQEATAIARRLRQLIEGTTGEMPVIDRNSSQPRALRPGDVAILFRALSDVRLYEEALREQGLEYYLVGGHAFYAQQEIFDVLNILRAIASSADEISLAGVLRSPFFALADESLFWLVERGGSLNAGLFDFPPPPELSGEEQAKVEAAARTLRQLRSLKDILPIAALVNSALDLTGYDAVLVTEFLGERKLANLQKLVEQARTADANDNDLNDFIVQLTEFISRPPKEPLASTSAESADVIRLMTIHRAKGLEFPFVVLPDLDRQGRPIGAAAALDDELGPLIRLTDESDGEPYATGMTLYDARERSADLEERKRLLYVATTRAADYLLLSSSVEALDRPRSDWMQLIAAHFNLESGEFIGELPATYERPKVLIAPVDQNPPKPVSGSRGPDLIDMLDDAHHLADEGYGVLPPNIGQIPVDLSARRQFSFSQLSEFDLSAGERTEDRDVPFEMTAESVIIAKGVNVLKKHSEAAGFGSLVHDVLFRVDYSSPKIDGEIAEWCEHLASEYLFYNVDDAAHRAAKMISWFAASPRGKQLAKAKSLRREVEFLLPWPISSLSLGERQDECVPRHVGPLDQTTRVIRGFIDCLYEDGEGTLRIIDFKTNEVAKTEAGPLDRLADHYRMQLYVYALAIEQATGDSPSELVLELLQPAAEAVFPWNDSARQEAVNMISRSIAAATKT